MVIGNGMVAKRFESYSQKDDFIIFASGVSNSKNSDLTAYQREAALLEKLIAEYPGKTLVYFSTCSLYDPGEKGSLYYLHKLRTEAFIRREVDRYTIFRVSNIVGRSGNPNTVLNFFYYHLLHKINFDLWNNTSRNLIDMDDMFAIADHILQNGTYPNQVVNIANPVSNNVKEIIEALESVLQLKGNYISIPRGHHFEIDISLILPVIETLRIPFGEDYLTNLIKKYYPQQ